jgi:hypothetical protein
MGGRLVSAMCRRKGMKRTEVLREDDHGNGVYDEGYDFGYNHPRMPVRWGESKDTQWATWLDAATCLGSPCGDFQCNHDEFVQDKGSEWDSNDIDELRFEKEEW